MMSKPHSSFIFGNHCFNVFERTSRQRNSVDNADAPMSEARLMSSMYDGVLIPMMKGRILNVAPPAPDFAIRSIAFRRSTGDGTPRSNTCALDSSSVTIENLTFQFFCPLNNSMYRSSFVHYVLFVLKHNG